MKDSHSASRFGVNNAGSGGAQTSQTAASPLLTITDLNYTVPGHQNGLPVLKRIDLSLAEDEILGLLGPNGCGKSTLLRLIAGLAQPDSGSIIFRDSLKKIGVVFQHSSTNLLAWKSAVHNVALPAVIGGQKSADALRAARLSLAEIGLTDLAERYPEQLSGGEQQLVLIARWMANRVDLLLVDEAWSMLDFIQRKRVYALLHRSARLGGSGIIVVSHNVSEVANLADRVVVVTSRPATVGDQVVFSAGNRQHNGLKGYGQAPAKYSLSSLGRMPLRFRRHWTGNLRQAGALFKPRLPATIGHDQRIVSAGVS